MNSRFRITVGSEPDYEELVGDIYYDDQIVCVVTQEDGFDAMRIEFFAQPEGGTRGFPLKDFEEILLTLKMRLWELRKETT